MKKILSIILALVLILSMTVQGFAATTNSDTIPLIRSENYDHIIDTTEIMSFLDKIDDKEKRNIMEAYFFMPITVSITESKNNDSIGTIKVSQEAMELASLSIDDLKIKYKSLMKQKVTEIISSENVLATPLMKEYLQKYQPDLVNSLRNKWSDSETVINDIEFNTTGEFSTMSIVPMNYYKALSYQSLGDTVLRASCNVDWNYDSSTKKITSLLPTTNFWYTGTVSPWYHILDPQGLYKNTQFITPNSSGDRGFVQKGRLILWQDGGAFTPISMFKFNLVFSPSATNTSKTLLNDTGCPPTNIVPDPVNWGGGY